ncbi:hypothetical protein SYNPS1DRAFT_27709 [Syncephalis pseudoplumigaleata]|uniref:Uncharacterized protein n=1 Tax=Syncephalis pseudoplumigaleata TaxID=1712513 RepID=A0A4P9Z278_9FUNG|nr:hypothetical protein SYNPS1DRAFT_27709 [Syncephalis pseudoplumigaleata]|eukprot:RKP26613.1 hypothetical protein SYNPS1DRAFT_27709 [Syncephalis pseudoplumigaleata]
MRFSITSVMLLGCAAALVPQATVATLEPVLLPQTLVPFVRGRESAHFNCATDIQQAISSTKQTIVFQDRHTNNVVNFAVKAGAWSNIGEKASTACEATVEVGYKKALGIFGSTASTMKHLQCYHDRVAMKVLQSTTARYVHAVIITAEPKNYKYFCVLSNV